MKKKWLWPWLVSGLGYWGLTLESSLQMDKMTTVMAKPLDPDPWQKSYGVWCGSNSGQRMSSWNMEGAAASSLGWKIRSRYSCSRHSVCWVWVSVLKKRVSLLFQDWRHDSVTVLVCWSEERAEYTSEAGGNHAGDVVSFDKHGNILLFLWKE